MARLRGSLVHRLLQSLPDIPVDRRRKAANDYLFRAGGKLATEERTNLTDQVMRVLDDTRFARLFAPGSRAEVSIAGKLLKANGEEVLVPGQIDRLAVTKDAILIGDFKTSRPAPQRLEDVPPSYVGQLALYRALLGKLYPDRPIRAALIWTEVPELMELSPQDLDAALARVTSA